MDRFLCFLLIVVVLGCAGGERTPEPSPESADLELAADIGALLGRLAPTELTVDLSGVGAGERQALVPLLAAARQMDEIFLRQAWEGNPELRDRLQQVQGPRVEAARLYFGVNFGPWDRLDAELKPFIGDRSHPPGAGFYPEDMSKSAFDSWLEAHPEDRERFTSLTTVIRKGDDGLTAIPYSTYYREFLEKAAEQLRAAAELTDNGSLERFLRLRADAFGTDDYYESDLAWMDLDSQVEVTIGPYETYEDGLFGLKAAFEAFVTVALARESAALDGFKAELPWLERNLPIPDQHKNLARGTESPIRVADLLFSAGDTKAGVQTIAFNLPNDERVREAKGSKKVLLRNVIRAKFDQILVPIAERVLTPEVVDRVSFDAFFNEILHHELSHGLGPGRITLDGRQTEVRLELKELYSTLEEAKADVMGIYNILALVERGVMPAELRNAIEPTYVAGLFRAARFGIHEAHGQGVVAQFNYLLEKGAMEIDSDGRFRPVSEKFADAMRDLLREILMLQATGDYAATASFLDTYGRPGEPLLVAIDGLADVPVDIRPLYPQAEELGALAGGEELD